jgi:hypothetical protein
MTGWSQAYRRPAAARENSTFPSIRWMGEPAALWWNGAPNAPRPTDA